MLVYNLPNLRVKTNTLDNTIWMLAGLALLLVVIYGLTRYFARKQAKNAIDPPYTKTVNDTNYNVAAGAIGEDQLEEVNREEKAAIRQHIKKGEYLPTDKEFHALKKS